MFDTILLILSGRWYPDSERVKKDAIREIDKRYGIDALLAELPKEEAEMFRLDFSRISSEI